jgi:hypothetical protein
MNPSIGTTTPDEWIIEFARTFFQAVVDKVSDLLFVITVRANRA